MIQTLLLIFAVSLPVIFGSIMLLRKLRGLQQIYTLSPSAHQKKAGTVSFGGIAIVGMGWIGSWIAGIITHPHVLFLLLGMTLFGMIGFADDLISVLHKANKGLSVRQKLILQALGCVLVLGSSHFFNMPIPLFLWPLYIFVGTGTTNATNLTDGLDGLLSGLSILTLLGFAVAFASTPIISFFCAVMISVLAAFLVFNRNPAQIFMGDTGSLALGGLFFSAAILLQNPWILIPLGGVYIMETLSVVIQVFWFKRTGKRIFKMSPLHHHFELSGFSEKQVVRLFWGLGLLFLFVFLGLR
jgi:phospho-N-acetylmuramoyl-pentapeptide-transferase